MQTNNHLINHLIDHFINQNKKSFSLEFFSRGFFITLISFKSKKIKNLVFSFVVVTCCISFFLCIRFNKEKSYITGHISPCPNKFSVN